MGLMDVLEPFATGFLEGKIDIAQAKADAQKEKDKLLAEEASAIRVYTAQANIQSELEEKSKLADRNLIKTDLLNEGMPAELLDLIPSRHLASSDTYNTFVTNEYDGNLNWYKQPFKKGDYEGTVGNYIIFANTNFNNAENTKSNLVGQGGVLEGQPNTANAMLEGDKKEEPTLTTDTSTQQKEVVETLEGIPEDTETEQTVSDANVPAFSGLGTAEDFFTGYDPLDEESVRQRDQNILKNIATLGGFGEGLRIVDGEYKNFMKVDDVENKRFNSINQLAIDYANEYYKKEGVSPSGNAAVIEAMRINDFIDYLASNHRNNQFDADKYPELAQAVNLNVINQSQALEAQLYEDLLTLQKLDLGYMPNVYYQEKSEFNPTPRKPKWYDTFQDDLDDALLLSSKDENYDANGNIITEDDKKEEPKTKKLTVKGKEYGEVEVDTPKNLDTLIKNRDNLIEQIENEINKVQKNRLSSKLKTIEREIKKLQEN